MAHQDRYGLTLSTSSAEAAAAYREGMDLMLAARQVADSEVSRFGIHKG